MIRIALALSVGALYTLSMNPELAKAGGYQQATCQFKTPTDYKEFPCSYSNAKWGTDFFTNGEKFLTIKWRSSLGTTAICAKDLPCIEANDIDGGVSWGGTQGTYEFTFTDA